MQSANAARSIAALPFLVASLTGCDSRVTHAQCTEMIDKYLDMVLFDHGGPSLEGRPPEEIRAEIDARKIRAKQEPRHVKAIQQCEAEVSKREYRCAMKAPNPEIWQACID